jgi:O-antigen ligase
VGVTAANWRGRPRRARLWPSSVVFYNDVALVILAATATLSVNFVGSLPGCEIVALAMLPFLLLRHGQRAFQREYMWFYALLGLWLLGTIVGDIYFQSAMTSRAKGVARVLCFGLDFATLAILINGSLRGFTAFTIGFAPAMAAIGYHFREDFMVAWKFGLGFALTLLALVIASHFYVRRKHWAYISIFLGIATLNLIFGARSQIAIDLVSLALILPIFERRGRKQKGAARERRDTLKVAVLLVLAAGAAYAANQAIRFGANHGFFDESTQGKFQTQDQGKLGVLGGGRPETLVAIQAIRDSPLLGHGSYAVDPKYNLLQKDIEYQNGYTESDDPDTDESGGIPAHSHLTQSWVESGIFGGVFWIYVLVLTFRGILVLISEGSPMAPLFAFLLSGFLWDILFSPMGSFDRMWGAFATLISYNLLRVSREKRLAKLATNNTRRADARRTTVRTRYIGPASPRPRMSPTMR